MTITIDPAGACHCLYTEAIPLDTIGQCTIRRASHVEPDGTGQWWADMSPVLGPMSGPFPTRSAALAAEVAYLEKTAL